MEKIWGGIEAGGTKMVCAIGSGPGQLVDEIRFPTTSPDEVIGKIVDYFTQKQEQYSIQGIGLGSFGPVDLNCSSSTYGYITNTPKPMWSQVDFLGPIKKKVNCDFYFDTDVNAAAYGEYKWGNARGLDNFIYLTIGTGVGGGAFVNGKLLHGLVHPEMGHIFLPRFNFKNIDYKNHCPFHDHCLEGYINGPSIEKNWHTKGENLDENHDSWIFFSQYLAYGLVNLICTLSPKKIILGGGVMGRKHLLPLVRDKVRQFLNGYIQHPLIENKMDEYIVLPGLGNQAGILGAIAMARDLIDSQ